ncbi:PRC-barrel domain-containing protein [Francisella tularensis]
MKDLILSATTLIGDDVVNYNGENLGEVKEIMLDTNTGEVAYVVVSYGGF